MNKILIYVVYFIGFLLVIFAFIFIGISAFSIGGSFGSVVNSAVKNSIFLKKKN
jgi:hypothetical protein